MSVRLQRQLRVAARRTLQLLPITDRVNNMDKGIALPVGIAAGMALGFAGAFGGFNAFIIVLIMALIGAIAGAFVDGRIKLSDYVSGRTGRSDR